jgi:hypothetical protein
VSDEHNVYRDGRVHVLAEECRTCIFRPHQRFVPGARVAELVAATKDTEAASVVCHSTLVEDVDNAVCRGWFDRLADRDPVFSLAKAMDVIEYDPVPAKL